MAVVGLYSSLIVFRVGWRDLIFALRVACIGRLSLEAELRAPDGRLLPNMSAGWDRIAVTQRRHLVFPLGAGVMACVGPLRPLWGAAVGAVKERSRPPTRVQKKNQPCLGSLAPSDLCRNTFVPLFGTGVNCTLPLPVLSGPPSFGPQGWLISYPDRREKPATEASRGCAASKTSRTCGQSAATRAAFLPTSQLRTADGTARGGRQGATFPSRGGRSGVRTAGTTGKAELAGPDPGSGGAPPTLASAGAADATPAGRGGFLHSRPLGS